MNITIGVCGSGTMGSGIAQLAAQNGFETIVFDLNENALNRAYHQIENNLDFLVQKNRMDKLERDAVLGRLTMTTRIGECTGEIIIEAIAENLQAKIELFQGLAQYNNEEVVFASNTSSLSITSLQEAIPFPERVVGMHFFNPPYAMKLVEVVRGASTRNEVAQAVYEICTKLGRVPVYCKDEPGFIVNRVARHFYLESLKVMEDRIASFEEIDRIMEATGFKMGPFRLMDMIGLDINLEVSRQLYQSFGQAPRFRPSKIQADKVESGLLGQKTGRGFYSYGKPRPQEEE
ncbi:MAG: 3-hydroxybutyryl-CoA dehydrogenase [Bacteroidota bacterium]|nr:3-hydroxybutyryl-CoA dehydrogenase [Bacteroidota bacterium]